jgi:hypothetical protein
MQEALLQFIWQYNLYRPGELKTYDGQPVQVLHPGSLNRDAGPDFSMARVQIGDTLLVGNVELHLRTSDWKRHGHDNDPAYSRIIMHVVYEHDTPEAVKAAPMLQLKEHIPDYVLERYTNLIQTTAPLPCAGSLPRVNDLTRSSWLSRMLVERWEQKLGLWSEELAQANGDWHTLFWWRLAANFGLKINATPFLLLAQSLPLRIITKQSSLLQIEALLFGQAGLLNKHFTDDYPQALQKEYAFLRHKYSLTPLEPHLWKFMRLRPASFPTIRLAQLAALIHEAPDLFTAISDNKGAKALSKMLSVKAGSYWDDHYRFDEKSSRKGAKHLGDDSAQNVIINTIAPIRFLYAHTQGKAADAEAALQLLDELSPEDNRIIRMLVQHGWKPVNAGNTQSLIQLYNNYCGSKRCLECSIGLSIIRSRPDK